MIQLECAPWADLECAPALTSRFWGNVDQTGPCWKWIGSVKEGSGCFYWSSKSYVRPHRLVFLAAFGDPRNAAVFQTCGDPLCVEPSHLGLRIRGDCQRKTMLEHLAEQGIDTSVSEECWNWGGVINDGGYGTVRSGKVVHRETYRELVGPIPDGLVLDHLCRNRACCNPAHLEAVTTAENNRRAGLAKRRSHCMRGHALTEDSNGRRKCRKCQAVRSRRSYERKKAKR